MRLLLMAASACIGAAQAGAPPLAPSDPTTMNAFVHEWKHYVNKLESGQRDLAQWARVRAAWERIQ